MNYKQEKKLNMYHVVRDFVNLNGIALKELPGFAENFEIFVTTIEAVHLTIEKQITKRSGITLKKRDLRLDISVRALDFSRKISAYAIMTDNTGLLLNSRLGSSALGKISDIAFMSYVMLLHDNIQEHIGELEPYGITPDGLKSFFESIGEFNSMQMQPRNSILDRKLMTGNLVTLFKTSDTALGKMDYSAGIISLSMPDLFYGYKSARRLKGGHRVTVALRGKVTDSSTHEPVKGVMFVFSCTDSTRRHIIKKSALHGGFLIRNMAEGDYIVRFSKPGYKAGEVSVSISAGERRELVVEVERV